MAKLTLLAGAGAILLAAMAAPHTQAQDQAQDHGADDYPSHTIRIIVCVPPGGGVDTVTRIVADRLRQRFGQPVVVENRGGQSGNLGAETVYAAEPDGYTLLASQPSPLTVNGLLYRKIKFDPAAFLPVAVMTTIPNTLTVRANFPAANAAEFIAYARAHPGELNYASQGTATTSHLTAELFQAKTGTTLQHVPYKGTAPAINDLIAGHVDLMFSELASAIELHRAGNARILAVTSARRAAQLPDIPTLAEAGVADVQSTTWNAISAPPRTPPAIVAKLNAAITDILAAPDVRALLGQLNMKPEAMTPQEAADFIRADARRWSELIRTARIAINY